MQKNYSPRLIAFITACFTFLLVFITTYLFFSNLLYCALVAAIVFIIVYVIVWYYVQEVMDKNIKTIYKFINQTKAGKREQFYNNNLLPRATLQDVTSDVALWASQNKEAFELLEKRGYFFWFR